MLHTFKPHQMHCCISSYNTYCKMTYGCSNMFLGHDWVSPSRILLLVLSPNFSLLTRIYNSSEYIQSQPHLTLAWMVKKDAPFRGRGLILELLLVVDFLIPYFYHGLETWITTVTMVILLHSSTSLLHFHHGKYAYFSYFSWYLGSPEHIVVYL